jgi:carboxyl-terminal processing protease
MKITPIFLVLNALITFSSFAADKKEAPKEASRFEQLELFNKVLFQIESSYYRKVDTKVLIEGAIKGMMETLDPHSSYLNEKVFSKVQTETSGKFGGIGVEVTQKDGIIVVITPIDDTPAAKEDLRPMDKIVEINHDSTLGMSLEEAVEKMRGPAGSKVVVGLHREGQDGIKHITFKRKVIKVKPVKQHLVKDRFAYVRLTQFQKNSGKSIAKSIQELQNQVKGNKGLKGIILDLRSNPGGLLDEAVSVSSLFLKKGIVVSTEGRDKNSKEIRYVNKSGTKFLDLPIVVLINGASASASEIVAGALQDHDRAIIMGSNSFGKGSVQTVAKINDEAGMKLTIAQYMTPKGRKIQAIGIKPDIEIEELDSAWIEKVKNSNRYLREADLRNHLVATIETAEEKEARLQRERDARIARIARAKARKEEKEDKKDTDKVFKKYNPDEDYQVLQAINYLKSFKVFNRYRKSAALDIE